MTSKFNRAALNNFDDVYTPIASPSKALEVLPILLDEPLDSMNAISHLT